LQVNRSDGFKTVKKQKVTIFILMAIAHNQILYEKFLKKSEVVCCMILIIPLIASAHLPGACLFSILRLR